MCVCVCVCEREREREREYRHTHHFKAFYLYIFNSNRYVLRDKISFSLFSYMLLAKQLEAELDSGQVHRPHYLRGA